MTTTSARRGRGEGSVYRDRAQNLWTGQLTYRDPATSKRVYRQASAKTKTEARAKLAALKEAMAKTGAAPSGVLTVAQVVENLMSNPPASWVSPQTVSVNHIHADKIIAALGKTKVTELTPQQVESRLLAPMVEAGHAKTTVIRCRGILRMVLKKAMRDQGLGRNVAELAEIPGYGDKPSARESRSMTAVQVAAMLAAAGITGTPRQGFTFGASQATLAPFWAAYVACAIMLGLRPGELTGMTWEHTDLDARTVAVRHSVKRVNGKLVLSTLKTDTSKDTLAMPRAVADVLRWLSAAQAKDKLALGAAYSKLGIVFASRAGQPLGRATVRSGFNRQCLKVIGETYQLRETRHTMISYLSHNGVPLEAISDLARHKDSTVTRKVYRHVLADEIKTAAVAWDGPAEQTA